MRIIMLLSALATPSALAQCRLEFVNTFWPAGTNGSCNATAVFDDGNGANLYVGGYFSAIGDRPAHSIARWDGAIWRSLGRGLEREADGPAPGGVYAIAVHDDDGDGPLARQLYVGGRFTHAGGDYASNIARWDGQRWSGLQWGLNGDVYGLLSFDFDGDGPQSPRLVAIGEFYVADETTLSRYIAVWDGHTWLGMAEGFEREPTALCAFDADGPGGETAQLFVAVSTSGASQALFRWDGTVWQRIAEAEPIEGGILALAAFDPDDDGPAAARLFAGGNFTINGSQTIRNLAAWDGERWSQAGEPDRFVQHLYSTVENGRTVLLASGEFEMIGGVSTGHVARWDGAVWSFVMPEAPRAALIHFDENPNDSIPSALFSLSSVFTPDGFRAAGIARWDGSAWSALATGTLPRGYIHALEAFDADGAGPEPSSVYAAGAVNRPNELSRPSVERWDGEHWSDIPMDANLTHRVFALASFDGGDGPALYAAGDFYPRDGAPSASILRWDGSTWGELAGAPGGRIYALTVHDDGSGPALYAAGEILGEVDGDPNMPINLVARWDGQRWSALGPGLSGLFVTALVSWDPDHTGPLPARLIATGDFQYSGPRRVSNVAAWDGTEWRRMGAGAPSTGWDAVCVPAETGDQLFVAADYIEPSGAERLRVAQWSGTEWIPTSDHIPWIGFRTLESFDEDGDGPIPAALFAGGAWRWDGSSWTLVAENPGQSVRFTRAFKHYGRPTLFIVGSDSTISTLARVGPAGDVDGNWSVDVADLVILLINFGTINSAAPFEGDLDGDADVDLNDLTLLLASFGSSC